MNQINESSAIQLFNETNIRQQVMINIEAYNPPKIVLFSLKTSSELECDNLSIFFDSERIFNNIMIFVTSGAIQTNPKESEFPENTCSSIIQKNKITKILDEGKTIMFIRSFCFGISLELFNVIYIKKGNINPVQIR